MDQNEDNDKIHFLVIKTFMDLPPENVFGLNFISY